MFGSRLGAAILLAAGTLALGACASYSGRGGGYGYGYGPPVGYGRPGVYYGGHNRAPAHYAPRGGHGRAWYGGHGGRGGHGGGGGHGGRRGGH